MSLAAGILIGSGLATIIWLSVVYRDHAEAMDLIDRLLRLCERQREELDEKRDEVGNKT